MVSSNKILTVSYGTFSCTLEGFDNSFDTMKAIAEYFRDLAQDDRYFGAEPPTPDAEMLARIAEREIERRVEARFEKGNLVLRPTEDAELPQGDVAPEPSSGAALAGTAVAAAAGSVALADALSADDTTDTAEPIDAGPDGLVDSDEVELDLSELDLDAPEEEANLTLEDATTEAEASDIDAKVEEDAIAEVVQTEAVAPDVIDALADIDMSDAPDADTMEMQDEVADAELVEDLPATTDSVAEKLQRIRAVVASKSQEEPEYIEDEHAMSGPDGDGNDENDAIDMDVDMPVLADTADLEDDLDEADNIFADTVAAIVNDQIDAEEEDPEVIDTSAPEADSMSDTEAELQALRAKIAELEAQAATPAPDLDVEHLEFEEHDADASDTVEPVTEAQPVVARVTKAKRADIEAALASGDLEEVEDDEPVAEAETVPGADESTLTPEQEQELARELAELQEEIDTDDDWDFDVSEPDTPDATEAALDDDDEESEANIRKAVKLTSPARAMLTDSPIEEDDTSVDRLIDQTESEMDEPEGNRRRSAIAHLRAAVAATKADRLLGLGKKQVDEEEPYREDLADAVRPRRPKVAEARSERPAPVRPAPLKLVAEQRVDTDEAPNDAAPVRPRRVMRAEQTDTAAEIAGDDTGFAEFAEAQGAHTLPELLEAAASYMSFVEGRDQFSRPQLMTKLLQTEGSTSSREERLRSFGQLLREGKIEKKGGGRFTASDNIGFKPDTRAVG